MTKSMGENGRYWRAIHGRNQTVETAKRGGSLSEDIEEMNGNGCRAKSYRDNYLLTPLYLAWRITFIFEMAKCQSAFLVFYNLDYGKEL